MEKCSVPWENEARVGVKLVDVYGTGRDGRGGVRNHEVCGTKGAGITKIVGTDSMHSVQSVIKISRSLDSCLCVGSTVWRTPTKRPVFVRRIKELKSKEHR